MSECFVIFEKNNLIHHILEQALFSSTERVDRGLSGNCHAILIHLIRIS